MANRSHQRPIRSVSTGKFAADNDDISELSMAGASVIAYRIQTAQKKNLEVGATIQEDDAENDVAHEGEQQRPASMVMCDSGRIKKSSSRRRLSAAVDTSDADFADDHLLKEPHKSKKKKKAKSKKHHKKDRDRDCSNDMSLPINEIYFKTDGPSTADNSHGSACRACPSGMVTSPSNQSVASTAESTGSRYQRRDSFGCSTAPHNSLTVNTTCTSQNPYILQSNGSRSSSASYPSTNLPSDSQSSVIDVHHLSLENTKSPHFNPRSSSRSAQSNYSIGSAYHSNLSDHGSVAQKSHLSFRSDTTFSNVTEEDIQHLQKELERAKIEEIKVLELHAKLESEVLNLIEQSETMDDHKVQVALELKLASKERERLQSLLNEMHVDNMNIQDELLVIEEREDEKRLNDVVNGLQTKMRALRLKSTKKGRLK